MDKTHSLAGGYTLLTTYARLTPDEYEATKGWDECPTEVIAVATEHLERWVLCSPYYSVEELLNNYTYDSIEGLAEGAERAGYLAFSYRASLDKKFVFPELCRGPALLAFADFLSGVLQEGGEESASKYLDAFLDI